MIRVSTEDAREITHRAIRTLDRLTLWGIGVHRSLDGDASEILKQQRELFSPTALKMTGSCLAWFRDPEKQPRHRSQS